MNEKTKPKFKPQTFKCRVKHTGGRTWDVSAPDAGEVKGGSPTVYGGESGRWSSEDLLLGGLNSCHLASFIALCRRKELEFVSYESEIEALLEHDGSLVRFTTITIRPCITVKSDEDAKRAEDYIHKAHIGCFMGNSVISEIVIEPEITVDKGDS